MQILHIAKPDEWAKALVEGAYTRSTRGQSLDDVGFIHCSRPQQVQGVLDAFYADLENLVLLIIDTDLLGSPWQLDPVPGATDPFPHIYGPLDVAAVVEARPLRRTPESSFRLPDLPGLPDRG